MTLAGIDVSSRITERLSPAIQRIPEFGGAASGSVQAAINAAAFTATSYFAKNPQLDRTGQTFGQDVPAIQQALNDAENAQRALEDVEATRIKGDTSHMREDAIEKAALVIELATGIRPRWAPPASIGTNACERIPHPR
ncbi:MAG TPA: hypothetical protein VKT83_03310 [bacterium]|nr:hypothetical protein [bacterium]